jgi:hypothetical protein
VNAVSVTLAEFKFLNCAQLSQTPCLDTDSTRLPIKHSQSGCRIVGAMPNHNEVNSTPIQ